MDLGIDIKREDNRAIVGLKGEIDVYTAPRFKESMISLIENGCHDLIIDLQGVNFMDSTGLGALVGGLKRVKPLGGSLVLVCSQSKILKILELTGLNKEFPIYDSLEEAEKASSD